jgi:hypothetical protein
MNKSDEQSAQEPQPGQPASVDGGEVRATMEQARQALEASRTEIERAKRLLRETEELVDVPGRPHPEHPSTRAESS